MIQVQKKVVASIPYLDIENTEVVSNNVMVAYHGWTQSKDEAVVMGMELAKQGFHVILPDCPYHGDRSDQLAISPSNFLTCIQQASDEFKLLTDELFRQSLSDQFSISVCGVSLGGIIAGMVLASYPYVKAGGILMGAPRLGDFLSYLLEHLGPQVYDLEQLNSVAFEISTFDKYDLSQHIDNIDGKPLFLWHALNDSVVPARFSQSFAKEVETHSAQPHLRAIFDGEGGHDLPYHRLTEMTDFLWNSIER